ncbi:hypothetical protein TNCV_4916621 [Trichonephila clavipes]|nr:hypothetical protein TNCV_4916621 [Trichonephila clavipes]
MNTCVINLNNYRTSEEVTTVIEPSKEIDAQLCEIPFNRRDQSTNLRQLGDVLDELCSSAYKPSQNRNWKPSSSAPVRIYPKTPYAYHQDKEVHEENSWKATSTHAAENKLLRAVIRCLPTDMSPTPDNC